MNLENENIPGPGHGQEDVNDRLLQLSRELGFIEDEETLSIRKSFMYDEGFSANEDVFNIWREYSKEIIDKITDKQAYNKARIGLLVLMADVYKNFDEMDKYEKTISTTIDYAKNLDLNDVVQKLQSLPKP